MPTTSAIAHRRVLLGALIPIFAAIGVFLGRELSWQEGVDQCQRRTETLARGIDEAVLTEASKAARSLAAHEAVRETAAGRRERDNATVMPLLQATQYLLRAAIVYVMDKDGLTVACTPYGKNETLTGKNYAFRPYFRQPMDEGKDVVYAALGVTTNERGLYFSSVIRDPQDGSAIGVVAVKTGLEPIDLVLGRETDPAALLSDAGIVFATNRPEWLFKAAYPMSSEERDALRKTRQFSDMPLDPLGLDLQRSTLMLGQRRMICVHHPVQIAGWQTMVLHPAPQLDMPLALGLAGGFALLGVFGSAAAYYFVAHRQSLLALRAERDRAQQYLDVAGVLFLALDAEGRVVLANPKACQVLAWPQEELLGRDWFEACVPEKQRQTTRDVFHKLMAGNLASTEYNRNTVRTRDGQELLIEWHNTVIRDDRGRIIGTLSSGEDVTERARMQEQIQQSDKLRSIGQLAGGIAHDFNNQLAVLLGYADLLREQLADNKELRGYATTIGDVVRRSADLTKQLLAFARKGKYQSVPVNMHSIIAEVISLLGRSIDKRIKLRQHLDANPPMTEGDPTQLQNALLNIALNARDAMPEGGELQVATEVVDLDEAYCRTNPFDIRPGRFIQIAVTDTGMGMDAETQKHIFEPFFTTKEAGKGTGMGLAAVYGTVKLHGGAVNVYSEVGHGTTMRLYLPLLETAVETEERERASDVVRGHGHILIVDDEERVRDMAKSVLQHLGYQVTTCKDGAEGVGYYREAWKTVDLVILDMVMPELGGRDAYVAMRQINPSVRAILASGYSLNGEAQAIMDQGIQGFVQKPFRLSELSRTIAQVLGSEKSAQC